MDTEDINTALHSVVQKAIADIDDRFHNKDLKDLLGRIVAKYEKILFGDVGIWVYGDRIEMYSHVSIRKKGYQHQFKGLIVVGYDGVKLGSISRVQFTKNSYLKVSESNEYELSERVEEVAIGLMGSDGNELNHGKVMEVLGKFSDSYYLVGIKNIAIRVVS